MEHRGKPRSILKKSKTVELPGQREIKWDEEAIREHDLKRGRTMKITEPKTPYHYHEGEADEMEEEENQNAHLQDFDEQQSEDVGPMGSTQTRLYVAEQNKSVNQNVTESHGHIDLNKLNAMLKHDLDRERKNMVDSDEEQEENEKRVKKAEDFKKKRSKHYDEGLQLRMLKQRMMVENDDEEEEQQQQQQQQQQN